MKLTDLFSNIILIIYVIIGCATPFFQWIPLTLQTFKWISVFIIIISFLTEYGYYIIMREKLLKYNIFIDANISLMLLFILFFLSTNLLMIQLIIGASVIWMLFKTMDVSAVIKDY